MKNMQILQEEISNAGDLHLLHKRKYFLKTTILQESHAEYRRVNTYGSKWCS